MGDVTCSGKCSNVALSVSPNIDSKLLCRNGGCESLNFNTENGMDDFHNLTVTNCSCEDAKRDSCIADAWTIYCDVGNGTIVSSLLRDNVCEGPCCGNVLERLRVHGCDYGGQGSSSVSEVGAIVG